MTGPTVAISQSNYLPWKGYFDIINDVDLFIFYDDVQFTKQDWRARNKIKTRSGAQWITVPVGASQRRKICEVEIPRGNWAVKHFKTLQQCYARAPFFDQYRPWLESVYLDREWRTLSELNQYTTTYIARELLGIDTAFADSRAFAARGAKTDRLLDILGKVQASRYVSAPAARAYLEEHRLADAGIELVYKDYAGYPDYPQQHPPLDHHVTILDLLLAVGSEAPRYIWGWRSEAGG